MKKIRIFAMLLAVALLALSFTACASSSKSAQYAESADSITMTETASAPAAAEMPSEPEAAIEESVEAEDAQYDGGSFSLSQEADYGEEITDVTVDAAAKIIYSANLQAQTTDFDVAVAALDKQIASFGGFIERSDISGDTRYNNDGTTTVINRWADYTIRVPASKFEEFLRQTEGLGNVISVSRYAENVTSQYTDYEARLSSLRTQEERLLAMLEKSEDVDSLIALEQRLADVRYELESIERNLRNLDLQISYSTVNLYLEEVEIYTPTVPVQRTFSEKLSSAFSDGWTGFVRGLQYFCLDLASILPGLVLFILIVLAILFIVRKVLRTVKAKREAKEAAAKKAAESENKPE